MSQLYSLENGILVPYTLSNAQSLATSARRGALGSAMQYSGSAAEHSPEQQVQNTDTQGGYTRPNAAANQPVSYSNNQPNSAAEMYPDIFAAQSHAAAAQQNSAPPAQQAPAGQNMAYQDLYMQAMTKVAEQEKLINSMQVELAKNAIMGRPETVSESDIDAAFDKFFGYED